MRVTVIHNPAAGDAGLDRVELEGRLEAAGFEVDYASTKKKGWKRTLRTAGDLVLAVGGDGTVAKVARRLAHTGVALAAIPAGTANNIARALGIEGSAIGIIQGLGATECVATDLGRLTGGPRREWFVEAIGLGLIPTLIEESERWRPKDHRTPGDELRAGRALAAELLRGLDPLEVQIDADGGDVSGMYLLVEVMNIATVGPRLAIAPDADPHDGLFDVVALPATAREAALEALAAGAPWTAAAVPAVRLRAARVQLAWRDARLHADDDVWPDGDPGGVHRVVAASQAGALHMALAHPPRS